MAPFSGIHSISTLSGFVWPTRSIHAHPDETGSHSLQPVSSTVDRTFSEVTRTATATSRQAHQTQTGHSTTLSQLYAGNSTEDPDHVVSPTETRHAALSHSSVTVEPSSTSLTIAQPSLSSNTALSGVGLPSATSVPEEAPPSLTDQTSVKIGLAFFGVVLFIAIALWVFFFGWPIYCKYQARRKAVKAAQGRQRQWWNWIKSEREKPWIPTRSLDGELPPVQHLSKDTPAVLGEVAAVSPLRVSWATTVGSWPLRSAPAGPASPKLGSVYRPFSFEETIGSSQSTRVPSSSQYDRMRSFETYRSGIDQVYVRPDLHRNPRQSSTIVVGVENATVVRMRSASPDVVKITKSKARPLSREAFVGTDSDDKFEEVDLGTAK